MTHKYIYSLFNDGRGNTTGCSPVDRYLNIFPQLRTPAMKMLSSHPDIPRKKASALWVTQVSHTTHKMRAIDIDNKRKHRYLYCDNFYTPHKLAKAIDTFTDGEMKVTGTIRLNFVGEK